MKALTLNNKILVQGSKVLIMPSLTEGATISFNVRGTCFPDRKAGNTWLDIRSSLPNNKMYINFSDGTGEHEFETKQHRDEIMHYFQDLQDPSKIGTIDQNYSQERTLYIRFDHSQFINRFYIKLTNVFGDFPSGLGLFNLDVLRLEQTYEINRFPTAFKGGRFIDLYFSDMVKVPEKKLTEWIYNSEILYLTLLRGVFDFSGSYTTNGLDKLKDILSLERLRIGLSNLKDISIPPNLNEAQKLKIISLRGDYVTLPKGITECERCEQLELSNNDGFGYGSVVNWGDGVTKMNKLVFLTYRNNVQSFPTPAPMGVENCPKIRSVTIGCTYRSQNAVNSHIMSWFDKLKGVADKKPTPSNNFRTVAFDIGTSITTTNAIRPSGIYQAPSGFILGENNGVPSTAMEAIYVFVKQWGWTVTVRNETNTGTEIYNP